MLRTFFHSCLLWPAIAIAQSYPPQAGTAGSTAIYKDSPLYVGWATGITVERGYLNKSNPDFAIQGNNHAGAGNPGDALGFPDGNIVSLGDEGSATVTFAAPIIDATGFDFAVFENGGPAYLELAFVEVSSDGIHFFRFPAHSQTQTATQIGSFGTPVATYINNLAGKYSGDYGVPFDLDDLPDDALLDKNNVTHVRIVDAVGSIDAAYATFDSFGNAVNDSFPTPFASGGFDLQAVGVIHQQALGIAGFEMLHLALYPNPARDFFGLNLKQTANIKILDLSGRIVLEKQIQPDEPIPVSQWQRGVYLVEIANQHHQKTIKYLMLH